MKARRAFNTVTWPGYLNVRGSQNCNLILHSKHHNKRCFNLKSVCKYQNHDKCCDLASYSATTNNWGHLEKVDQSDCRKITIHSEKVGCGPISSSQKTVCYSKHNI